GSGGRKRLRKRHKYEGTAALARPRLVTLPANALPERGLDRAGGKNRAPAGVTLPAQIRAQPYETLRAPSTKISARVRRHKLFLRGGRAAWCPFHHRSAGRENSARPRRVPAKRRPRKIRQSCPLDTASSTRPERT